MHDGKEKRKKTKGKSRLLLDSHKKLHQRPVKQWTGRHNVSPLLLLLLIITSHYYYCCCTSASNRPAALLLACLLAAAFPIAFVSSDRAPLAVLNLFLLVFFPVLFSVYAWFSPRLATTTLVFAYTDPSEHSVSLRAKSKSI